LDASDLEENREENVKIVTVVDDFLDWSSFDRSWPHGGYEVDVEKEGDALSNKENEWVAVPVDE